MSESIHEVVVEGPLLFLKGFLAGTLISKGVAPEEVIFAEEHAIRSEGLIERVAEWVHLHPHDSHLLIPPGLYSDVKEGLMEAARYGLKIISDRLVRAASCEFSYVAYSRRHAEELATFIKGFAQQLQISDDYQPLAHENPQAKGVEAYASAHDYEVHARGTARGNFSAVRRFHDEGSRHSLMKVSPITLLHVDD